MKIHYKRRESISTLCGLTVRDNRHVLTRDFSSVTCEKCKSTNWWRDSPGPNRIKMGSFVNGINAAVKRLDGLSIFSAAKERCKNCGESVRMICMTGTGYCCQNCKDTFEQLNHKETT